MIVLEKKLTEYFQVFLRELKDLEELEVVVLGPKSEIWRLETPALRGGELVPLEKLEGHLLGWK